MSKNSLGQLISLWLPPLLWAFVIFSFSAHPTQSTSEIYWQDFIVKKMAHMIEYGLFATLLFRAFRGMKFNVKRCLGYSLLIAVFYGFTDEFHQGFTPGREPHIRDVVFDTIGASIACFSLWKLLPNLPPKLINLAAKWGFR